MDEIMKLLGKIKEEEENLQFDKFNNDTALELGLILIGLGKQKDRPITIDITKHGQKVFHYAFDGTSPDNDEWINRKNNIVNRFFKSSLHIGTKLKAEGKTLEEKYHITLKEYAPYGGAFPIYIRNAGAIGTISVSGLSQLEDHELVVSGIKAYLQTLKG